MKLNKWYIPVIICILYIIFMIGVLVGCILMRHNIKSNPEEYGLYIKSTKPKCSCVCCDMKSEVF